MSLAIYLNPKSANNSNLIYIQTYRHNLKGRIEEPNGHVTTLMNGEKNAKIKN